MRLLSTHSHASARQGYEADKGGQKKEAKGGLAVRDRNKSSTKAIAIGWTPKGGGVKKCLRTSTFLSRPGESRDGSIPRDPVPRRNIGPEESPEIDYPHTDSA